ACTAQGKANGAARTVAVSNQVHIGVRITISPMFGPARPTPLPAKYRGPDELRYLRVEEFVVPANEVAGVHVIEAVLERIGHVILACRQRIDSADAHAAHAEV